MRSVALLTIAIPTYNRAAFLELSLRRLNEEVEKLPESSRRLLNVHILNNASTDRTSDVIARYRHMRINHFNVIERAENIGPDANIEQCYRTADAPYVWILGDDDVVLSDGIRFVLECIANQDVDMIYLGSYGFTDHYLDHPKTRIPKHGTRIYDDPTEFAKLILNFALISCIVARTGFPGPAGGVIEDSYLIQTNWIFALLRDGRRFAYIRDWVIASKMANSSGYNLVDVFGKNLRAIAKIILRDRPRLIEIIENHTILYFFPAAIMRQLRSDEKRFVEENLADKLKRDFGHNWRYRVVLIPLVYLPKSLAKAYYFLTSAFLRLFPRCLL